MNKWVGDWVAGWMDRRTDGFVLVMTARNAIGTRLLNLVLQPR